nr:MAG TPA: hypothetical protein [Caudoviricetes sp.]
MNFYVSLTHITKLATWVFYFNKWYRLSRYLIL